MQLQQRFNEVLDYMDYYIEVQAKRTKTHYRVFDNNMPQIKFPLNHKLGDKNLIDWEMCSSNNGWGKADKKIGNVELRYLWKNEKLLNFEEWRIQQEYLIMN